MTGLFRKMFEGVRVKLVDNVDLKNGLLSRLRDKKVITPRQYEECESCKTDYKRLEELLNILERRPNDKFDLFCEALIEDDQQHIVDEYLQPVRISVLSETSGIGKMMPPLSESTLIVGGNRKRISAGQLCDDDESMSTVRQKHSKVFDDEVDHPVIEAVLVKLTTHYFYHEMSKEAYPMASSPKGTVCIINIQKTLGMSERRGTDVDCRNLISLFEQFGFHIVVYNDDDGLESSEILTKVKLAGQQAVGQCFVLFTLSHGGRVQRNGTVPTDELEVIFGTDGRPVPKRAVIESLYNASCPNLRNKPRIVFFQSCRGVTEGLIDEADAAPTAVTQPDFLICYPCQEDMVSLRNPAKGSRYIRCIVDVFMNNAYDSEICALLTKVNSRLPEFITSDRRHQVASFEHRLLKPFYFFPGIMG